MVDTSKFSSQVKAKPVCYLCSARGAVLKRMQFYVRVAGKLLLERHLVCGDCAKTRLKAYH